MHTAQLDALVTCVRTGTETVCEELAFKYTLQLGSPTDARTLSQSTSNDKGMTADSGWEGHLGRGVDDRGRIVREADVSDAILSAVDAFRGLPGKRVVQPDGIIVPSCYKELLTSVEVQGIDPAGAVLQADWRHSRLVQHAPELLCPSAGTDLADNVVMSLQITLNTLPMPKVRMMSSSSCIT